MRNACAVLATLLIVACAVPAIARADDATDEIPTVGMTDEGAPVEAGVPGHLFQKRILKSLETVRDSTLSALHRHRDGLGALKLHVVNVGVAVSGEVGIGAYKAAAAPRFRLLFCNIQDPPLP